MTKPEKDSIINTALRLPRTLHAELHAAAEHNFRSLNAEIVARLVAASSQEQKLDEILRQNSALKTMLKEILENTQNLG